VLLITTSAFIDLFGLFLLGSSLFGPSLRPGIGLLLLFVLRQVSQMTCALPTPAGMIWRSPGFPSLLVTYNVANDFFFSGHTAIATLGAIEVARIGPWWLSIAAAIVALAEATTILVLRAHYTMDVFTGAIAAFCAAALAASICVGF
jgi:membrane-associated phospholipid phosphatase